MSNIIINNSSYILTSSIDRPRLKVSNSYIPLTTKDNRAKVYVISNNSKYNIMSYSTSSSSSSTMQTTGYSGISSRQSYYYTTSNAPGYMSSITNLTRASTSATLTRASTYATLTRASTSGTNYGTQYDTKTIYSFKEWYTRVDSSTSRVQTGPSDYATRTYGIWRSWSHLVYITATYTITTFYAGPTGTHAQGTITYPTWTYYSTTLNAGGRQTISTIVYNAASTISSNFTSNYIYNHGLETFTVEGYYVNTPILTTGTTYLTRESISGYATRESIYGYATRQSISGYAGSLSRQSNYYTSSTAPGAMSNITYLTSSASESASTTTWV